MKPFHLRFLETALRYMALAVLRWKKPIVVGITGSVGKSSAKEAVATVLRSRFRIRASVGNMNNEIGIPLTIIGSGPCGRSLGKWLLVPVYFLRALLASRSKYPEVLVLELGIDRIGDMEYLLGFLKPDIGILTSIATSHLEFFKTISTVAREKGKLVQAIPRTGCSVLNADDDRVLKFREKTKSKVFTYGFSEKAEIRATNISFFRDASGVPVGTSFKLEYEGKIIPVRLTNVIAEHHISAALAAAAVGIFLRISVLDVATALGEFRSLPGRMRLLEGIRHSLVIDDTYNASPKSLKAALNTLRNIGDARKFVALGDMLELGTESDSSHAAVAEWVLDGGIDEAFFVGKRMEKTAEILENRGFSHGRIHVFSTPEQLGESLANSLCGGDVVLVKGSQGMRLEKAVEMALEDPSRSRGLLCRQSDEWRATPFSS